MLGFTIAITREKVYLMDTEGELKNSTVMNTIQAGITYGLTEEEINASIDL